MVHKLNYIIAVCTFVFFCIDKNNERCEILYEKAVDCWYQYSITNDSLCLQKSIQYIDSIDCKPVKHKVFELKISLMYLSKDYEGGKNYVASFNSSDFGASYKKDMYLKSFEAMIFESKGDTAKQNQLYREIIKEIQKDINKNPNKESLYDLFMAKRKIENRNNIIKEIEHIRSLNIYDNSFLDALIETINRDNDTGKTVIVR